MRLEAIFILSNHDAHPLLLLLFYVGQIHRRLALPHSTIVLPFVKPFDLGCPINLRL